MTRKYGYKYFSEKKRKNVIKKLSVINGLLLILQMSLGSLFFIAPINMAQAEVNQNLCSADVDVILVMDRSGSMGDGGVESRCEWENLEWVHNTFMCVNHEQSGLTEGECQAMDDGAPQCSSGFTYTSAIPNKIEDAKTAANSFLDNLGISDQSALVSFASDATLNKTLSNNHGLTQTAVNALVTSGATNIGDAIVLANTELGDDNSNGNSQANKVMILLTDGKANRPFSPPAPATDPEDYAERKAEESADQGIKIFTIGLGGDVNSTMLENIADITGANYYNAPTSAELESIYNEISQRICESSSISGYKYIDFDGYGDISDKVPASGWEIVLGGDVNRTQFTDADGYYSFVVPPGDYTVSEKASSTYIQTYPVDKIYNINLGVEDNRIDINFGNHPVPAIPDVATSTVYIKKFIDNATSSSAGWEMNVSVGAGILDFASSTTLADVWLPFEITLNNATSSVQVSETSQDGYNLVDIVCTLGLEGSEVGEREDLGIYDIEVENGSEVYCSFYNETISEPNPNPGSITIMKDAGDSQEEFNFISNYIGPFSLTSGQSKTTALFSGLYSIYEKNLPSDWILDDIECGVASTTCINGGILIELSDEEDVVCTFYNIYDSEPNPGPSSYCGDGDVDSGEECDDGNTANGDGCNSSCQKEHSSSGGGYYRYVDQGETVPEEVVVLGEEGEPALVIEKTISQAFANNGDDGIEYQVVVANNGNMTAFDVVLNDSLPDGLVYAGTNENSKTWDLGDIESGKSIITKYSVDVLSSAKSGVYENTAQVSASNHEELSDTASLEVREIVVLAETGFDIKEFMALGMILMLLVANVLYLRRKLA